MSARASPSRIGGSETTSRAACDWKSSSWPAARPPPMSASAVRFQARKVRSLASVKRGSGSRPTARRSSRRAIEQPQQPVLVEYGNAQGLRLGELRAGVLARDDIVGLLGDARRDPPAGGHDPLAGLLAREVGQRAGEHERFAGQRTLAGRRALELERDALAAQVLEERAHVLVGELLVDPLGHLRADARRRLDLLGRGRQQRIDRAELLGEVAPGDVADLLQADGEEHAPEAAVLGRGDVGHRAVGADLAPALELGQLLGLEPVVVARRPDQPRLLQLGDLLLAEAVDVHRPARDEVLEQLPAALGALPVRALREDLALDRDRLGVAERAALGRPRQGRPLLVVDDVRRRRQDLRYDVAGAQHYDVLARAQVLADDVL